jgi:transposase-like protein
MPVCPQCQRDQLVNHSSVAGTPKQLCKPWGYQCTRTTSCGTPLVMQGHAGLLSLRGLAMPRLAFLLRVSAQSALNWHRTVAQAHDEKSKPAANAIIVELDEMWPSLKHTRRTLWIWKTLAPDSGQLLAWACGRRDKTTLQKRVKPLAPWDVKRYGTDQWVADASVIS